jgi:acyl-CoA thioester hydrolase
LSDHKTESEIEIKTYDIDVAGHVNNIVYIRWIEDLRSELLGSCYSMDELLEKNLYPVVTSTNIRYRSQLKLSDRLKGIMWVDSVKHGLMQLKVIFQRDDETIATAEQNCVLMDLETGKMNRKAMEVYS